MGKMIKNFKKPEKEITEDDVIKKIKEHPKYNLKKEKIPDRNIVKVKTIIKNTGNLGV